MEINQAGIDLIKSFEGCYLRAYQDIVGILTIGYGHCGPDVQEGMEISQAMADLLLKKDLEHVSDALNGAITAPATSNQFSALVSFAFNVGVHACVNSHLLKYLNSGDIQAAANEFPRWDKAGGNVVAGLLRRREAEKALFLTA